MAVDRLDVRAGTEVALARVVRGFGAACPHHAYLFANRPANWRRVQVSMPMYFSPLLPKQIFPPWFRVADERFYQADLNVAAAVLDDAHQPVAAVSISVPKPRWTLERARGIGSRRDQGRQGAREGQGIAIPAVTGG